MFFDAVRHMSIITIQRLCWMVSDETFKENTKRDQLSILSLYEVMAYSETSEGDSNIGLANPESGWYSKVAIVDGQRYDVARQMIST